MARHEGDFRSSGDAPLEFAEVLALLDKGSETDASIAHARACYLSSSDGWREAVTRLGGAFAEGIAALTELKDE